MYLLKFQLFVLLLGVLILPQTLTSQVVAGARPGPAGIYINLGKNIPGGKNTLIYTVERRENYGDWQQVAVVRTPLAFAAFKEEIEKARKILPSQPIPSDERLKGLYDKAIETGTSDSLKGWGMSYPFRLAIGLMYHDPSAIKGTAFQYRITETAADGQVLPSVITDTLSMPYKAEFDPIQLAESSSTMKAIYIKWMSAGKNPPPLFMVNRYEGQQVINAGGATGRYTKNDTTYFTFRDSTQSLASAKDLIYALIPFDQIGNIGTPSQKVMITHDPFNQAEFRYTRFSRLKDGSGNRISWLFSNPVTVQTMELYRSEKPDMGYARIAVVQATDTVFTDTRLQPAKDYYYYVQAIAKSGKRFKPGEKILAPGFQFRLLQAPVITESAGLPGGVKLTIRVEDPDAKGFRVFRTEGSATEWVAISDFIPLNGNTATFLDSDPVLSPASQYNYTVRAEKPGYSIGALSQPVTVSPLPKEGE